MQYLLRFKENVHQGTRKYNRNPSVNYLYYQIIKKNFKKFSFKILEVFKGKLIFNQLLNCPISKDQKKISDKNYDFFYFLEL